MSKKSGNKKSTFLDTIKELLIKYYEKVDSKAGRVNLFFGLALFLIIIALILQPIAHYILLGIQYIINMVLTLSSKSPISISNDAGDLTIVILFCIGLLFLESLYCTYMVKSSKKE